MSNLLYQNNMQESRIAQNYALALFNSLGKLSMQEQILQQLLKLSKLLSKETKLRQFLNSPINSKSSKFEILTSISKVSPVDNIVTKFLTLLVVKSRFKLLDLIIDRYNKQLDKIRNVMEVTVTSASALEETEMTKLQRYLEHKFNKLVDLHYKVDSSLIGGLVVKYDSQLIDYSARGTLQVIEKATVKLSASNR